MNKRTQEIIRQLMGSGNSVAGSPPSTVQIHKSDRLKLAAVQDLINLGVAIQVGTRCEGDILCFDSSWEHFYGDKQRSAKTAGLD